MPVGSKLDFDSSIPHWIFTITGKISGYYFIRTLMDRDLHWQSESSFSSGTDYPVIPVLDDQHDDARCWNKAKVRQRYAESS